jgi:hypothetical protein
MVAHVVSRNIPNSKQDALSFVIARAILVRLSKIAKSDWSVNGRNNVRQSNVARGFG